MPTRRDFLHAALGVCGSLLLPAIGHAETAQPRLLSPASRGSKHFAVSLGSNAMLSDVAALPMRGHGLLLDPHRPDEALVIARRPGSLAAKIDLNSGGVLRQWQAAEDRHFFGHACYSADGRILFVTENDIENGRGLVTVRDATSFRLLAEYPSHGIGPHDILLLPDGVTLAVANGGVLTLPETGRVKLNRGRIESNLAYLDSRNGRLLGRYAVASNQLSLRHLALAPNGRLAAALQFEGERYLSDVPLMVFHRGEPELQFAQAPPSAWNRMRHYAASVAYDPRSASFALSCPRGDTLACWSAGGEYAGHIDIPKVSGIAFGMHYGFASNELGEVYRLDLARRTAQLHARNADVQWDNHLYLSAPV